jgi:hypothetical protein
MTIAAQLLALRGALAAWAQTLGGDCHIAGDPAQFAALVLEAKPGGISAFWSFQREEAFGDCDEAGKVLRTYTLVLTRGKGFQAEPADTLVVDDAAGKAMYDLVGAARELVRGLEFTPESWEAPMRGEVVPGYRGARPWPAAEGLPVDATELEFTVIAQLAAPA